MSVIAISHLTKYYDRSKSAAVSDVSLTIKAGEVYGFLGANGAGKSTTLRSVMGFLRPTSGTIKILGQTVSEQHTGIHRKVGYLPGEVVLPKGVTGHEFLAYLGGINNEGTMDSYRDLLIERFEAQLDKPVNELSKGNRQKIGIIQAFMHQPQALVLDEPTSGLDPLMQEQFYKTVEEAQERGAAVLLSSHSFDEVERICTRVGIIRSGRFAFEGTVAQIAAGRLPRWRITFKREADVQKLLASPALKILNTRHATIIVEPAKSIDGALGALAGYPIAAMTTYQRELEEEFMHFYTSKGKSA